MKLKAGPHNWPKGVGHPVAPARRFPTAGTGPVPPPVPCGGFRRGPARTERSQEKHDGPRWLSEPRRNSTLEGERPLQGTGEVPVRKTIRVG